MSETICEAVCKSAMAIADGYKAPLQVEEIRSHLNGCAACRSEVEGMKEVMGLLDRQKRRTLTADVWEGVERAAGAEPSRATDRGWRVLLIAPLLLLGYKVAELALAREPGFAFKLLPLLIAVALFALLRENPFKVNAELNLEGE